MISSLTGSELKAGAAVLLAGIHAGAMTFGGAVDVRTLGNLAGKKDSATLKGFLPGA